MKSGQQPYNKVISSSQKVFQSNLQMRRKENIKPGLDYYDKLMIQPIKYRNHIVYSICNIYVLPPEFTVGAI